MQTNTKKERVSLYGCSFVVIFKQARRKHYGNAGFGRRTFLLPRYVFFLDEEKKLFKQM